MSNLCSLSDVKQYLSIDTSATSDDALLSVLLEAAEQRIQDYTKRRFYSPVDVTRYYDAIEDTDGRVLFLGCDFSHITSVTNENGDSVASTEYTVNPRNTTPWRELRLKGTSPVAWGFTTAPEDAITVTGRDAVMLRRSFSAISRASNVVTATVTDVSGITKGGKVSVVSVADSTFNGEFTVTDVTGNSVKWAQTASNDTDTTGVILICPPSIRQAAIRLTAWLYRQKDNQNGDADRPLLAGDGTVIMPTTLPADVQALLREWVRII